MVSLNTVAKLDDKMLKMGFEQEPEFDKLCGSPSYQSEESNVDMKKSIMEMSKGLGIENVAKQHLDSIENEDSEGFSNNLDGVTWKSYDKPTNIVLLGHSESNDRVEITDDETSYNILVDGETNTYGSMGFLGVYTIEEYKNLIEDEQYLEMIQDELVGGVVLPNFTGEIKVCVVNHAGEISKKFKLDDYVQHQFDDYIDVTILLPDNSVVLNLNEDGSLPISAIRDIKIDTIIN